MNPAPLDLDRLVFPDAAQAERFRAIQSELDAVVQGGTGRPLAVRGNNVGTRWCNDVVGSSACQRGLASRSRAPGTDWWELNTRAYPSSFPQVFGLYLARGLVKPGAAWGIVFSVDLDSDSFSTPYLQLHFIDGSKPEDNGYDFPDTDLLFGNRLEWQAFDTVIDVSVVDGVDRSAMALDLLTRLNASPQALSELMSAGYQALEDEVLRALDAGEVTREELQMDQYKGDGIEPPSLTLALTPQERSAEADRVRSELARRRAVVADQAVALHAALRAASPRTLVP